MLVMNIMEMMATKSVSSGEQNAVKEGGFADKFEKAVAGTGTFKETKDRVETASKPEKQPVNKTDGEEVEAEQQEGAQEEDRYVPYAMIPIMSVNQNADEIQAQQADLNADIVVEIGEQPSVVISRDSMGVKAETMVAGSVDIAGVVTADAQIATDFAAALAQEGTALTQEGLQTVQPSAANQAQDIQQAQANVPQAQGTAQETVLPQSAKPEAAAEVQSAARQAATAEEIVKNLNNLAKSAKESEKLDDNTIVRQIMDEAAAAVKDNAVADGYRALEAARPVNIAGEGSESTDKGTKEETSPQLKLINTEPSPMQAPQQSAFSREIQSLTGTGEAQTPQQAQGVKFQIIEQVKSMVSQTKSELTLQLKPHHLGGLSITLTSDQNGITAKLVTASKDAHMLIQSEMAAMQEVLRDKGVHVVEMEVIYDQMANTTGKGDSNGGQGAWSGQNGQTDGSNHGGLYERTDNLIMMYEDLSGTTILAEQGGSVEFSA